MNGSISLRCSARGLSHSGCKKIGSAERALTAASALPVAVSLLLAATGNTVCAGWRLAGLHSWLNVLVDELLPTGKS